MLMEPSPYYAGTFQTAANQGLFASPPNLPAAKVLAGFILERKTVERLNSQLTQLTAREIEVLQGIADGNANKQTASKLGIHIKTVEKHRGNLMQKLNIHHTAGLTRYAICAGLIENSVQLMAGWLDAGKNS